MKGKIVRLGGIAAVLGGVFLLILAGVQALNTSSSGDGSFWQIVPFMPVILTIGVAGLYAISGNHRWLKISLLIAGMGGLIMAAGLALMAWFDSEIGWSIWFLGMILHPLGILLFGIGNLRARVLIRWNGLPFVFGLFIFLLLFGSIVGSEQMDFITEQQSEMLFALLLLTLGAVWMILGVDLLTRVRKLGVPAAVSILVLAFLLSACSAGGSEPRVSFQSPKDGDTVSSPLNVVLQSQNFSVEAAGEVHDGAGHLHIMVDVPCIAMGEVIPKDEQHLHFGDGSTEVALELTPGEHRLCLQAADGVHIALDGPGMTHEIEVTVP